MGGFLQSADSGKVVISYLTLSLFNKLKEKMKELPNFPIHPQKSMPACAFFYKTVRG